MKLSIAMMVKNESQHLDECLNSLMPIMNELDSEIIVVDTGSEDNTVEIAKKHTNKVYFHEWNGNFAEMRNISIGYTKGEWIFVIDGDEVVENPQQLVCFLKSSNSDNYNTGVVTIKSYLSGDIESAYEVHLNTRLFRKHKDFKYEGAVHEQPKFELPVMNVGVQLLHYGYISSDKELMERKFYRNVEILKSELEKDRDNIYYWFQLAQSYGMHKDFKDAMDACIKAYQIVKKKKANKNRYKYVYNFLVYVYYWNNKYEEVIKICKETLKIRDGNIDIYYFLGHAQMKLSKYSEALDSFKRYLKLHKTYDKANTDFMEPIYTLGYIEEIYLGLSIIYKELKQYNQAIEYINLLESDVFLKRGISTVIDLYIETDKYEELKKYYDKKLHDRNENINNQFIIYLESAIKSLDKTKKDKIYKNFANIDNDYSILNTVRLEQLQDNPINNEIVKYIKALELNTLPEFYGDVIYYLLKRGVSIKDIFPNLKEVKLFSHLRYLSNKDEFSSIILKYLKQQRKATETNNVRINKTLAKYVLLQNEVNKDDYRYILSIYIEYGTKHIREIYNSKVIENEMIYDLKDDEDIFLLYMYNAEKVKYLDMAMYIKYLRKALKAYPFMKEGIELLLDEAKESIKNKDKETIEQKLIQDGNNELDTFKSQVKSQIEEYINNSKIQEARNLIKEYEDLVPKDADILCMKGIIAMIEQDLESAQRFFEEGHGIDSTNFDILYNLGYLLKMKNEINKALDIYNKAVSLTTEVEVRNEILKEINILSQNISIGRADVSYKDEKKANNASDEFSQCKENIKKKIIEFIDEMKLEEAMTLIKEYEQIVPKDLEILMYKSKIAVNELR